MDCDYLLLDWLHEQIYEVLMEYGTEVRAGLDPTAAEIAAIEKTQALCKKLQEDLGGRPHYLPALGKQERHRRVVADLQAGLSLDEVAEKHDLHLRTVKKIFNNIREASNDDPGLGTRDWMID